MNIIEKIINFYSLNDEVQTLWAWKRTFTKHPKIYNIQLFLNHKEPTHSEMHDPLIAQWIIYLKNISLPHTAKVHLFTDNKPIIKKDLNQKEKLEKDAPLNLNSFMDWRKHPV